MASYATAVPFEISGSAQETVNHYGKQHYPPETHYGLRQNQLNFPATRTVLWDRTPVGRTTEISFLGSRSLRLVINEKTLLLAYKHMQINKQDLDAFFLADINFEGKYLFKDCNKDTKVTSMDVPVVILLLTLNRYMHMWLFSVAYFERHFTFSLEEQVTVYVNRFDPGKDGYITSETGPEKVVRIPTINIPGDFCIPLKLISGMAFVDHETTETHTTEEFKKSFQLLESLCTQKDHLNFTNLFMMKMICCFHSDINELLAFLTAGLLHASTCFKLMPIHSIPVIPTTLARNLQTSHPSTYGGVHGDVRAGYITMDQTRKLLLFMETDPKAFVIPLVGIWISGVPTVDHVNVWAACVRFIYNQHIQERVYTPPYNFLVVIYQCKSANPLFYEFSIKNVTEDQKMQFSFVSCSEGIQIDQDSQCELVSFDLEQPSEGRLARNFQKAVDGRPEKLTDENNDLTVISSQLMNDCNVEQVTEDASNHHDDSLPSNSPAPHPQITQVGVPSVPDLSVCDASFVIESTGQSSADRDNKNSPDHGKIEMTKSKNIQPYQPFNIKNPRPTKASLARININKPVDSKPKKTKSKGLAIKFNKSAKKDKVTNLIATSNLETPKNHNQEELNLAVPVRSHASSDRAAKERGYNKQRNFQSYCPENYSDMDIKDSFVIDATADEIVDKVLGVDTEVINSELIKDYMPQIEPGAKESEIKDGFKIQLGEKESDQKVNSFNDNCQMEHQNLSTKSFSSVENIVENEPNDPSAMVLPNKVSNQGKSSLESNQVDANVNKIDEQQKEDKSKTELMDLMLIQQKQLDNLREQLQVFLNHQANEDAVKEKQKTSSPEQDVEKEKENKNEEVLLLQQKQQLQLDEIQKQVHIFLQSTAKNPHKINQCTQYDNPLSSRPLQSVAVNTGASLLSETANATFSKNTEQQTEAVDKTEERGCRFCKCHCKESVQFSQYNDSLKNNASVNSPSLSDIQPEDIPNQSVFEDTASSTRTLASCIQAVDLPVFNDSQTSQTPAKSIQNITTDWNDSPELGESASVLIQRRNQRKREEEENTQKERDNNQEFSTAKIIEQVHNFIEAQNKSSEESEHEDLEQETIDLTEESKVRDATIRELRRITNRPDLISPQKDLNKNPPNGMLLSKPAVNPFNLPKINYVSMSLDDSSSEDYSAIDEIAAKYIPKEQFLKLKKQSKVKNKTIKFEGVYEWKTPGKTNNMTSVNFSCNMSMATRKYLEKYELTRKSSDDDRDERIRRPLQVQNSDNPERGNQVSRKTTQNDKLDKENILDLKKLRNLRKLK